VRLRHNTNPARAASRNVSHKGESANDDQMHPASTDARSADTSPRIRTARAARMDTRAGHRYRGRSLEHGDDPHCIDASTRQLQQLQYRVSVVLV
jgi:hypothetical protein